MMQPDLETIDPHGRLDVLAYRVAEYLTKQLEEKHKLQGIWDSLKPHASLAASKMLGSVELPTQARILLSIIQANQDKLL